MPNDDGQAQKTCAAALQVNRRVTAKDLAERLGVAVSSISRAFDNDSRISSELRQRIISLADSLGYRPNAIARSLNQQRTGIVALVMGNFDNPFYTEALERFSVQLQQVGRQLLLFVVPPGGDADEMIPHLMQYQVDAVVVTAARLSSHIAAQCMRQGVPVVFMNRRVEDSKAWSVCCNNQHMAHQVADYLVSTGRRACAFVAGDPSISTTTDRLRGFEQGLAAHGLRLIACELGGYSFEGGLRAAARLFAPGAPGIDAVFCANDVMALSVLSHLRQHTALRVPEDVAVVGFDDIRAAAYAENDLTTVQQPLAAMIDQVIRLIAEGCPSGITSHGIHEIPGQLIRRRSA